MPACLLHKRCLLVWFALLLPASCLSQQKDILTYAVEWRLIRAGTAKITLEPVRSGWQGDVDLESAGLVSKLYPVSDHYTAQMTEGFCATSTSMKAQEGSRRRETIVNYDRSRGMTSYVETDFVKNKTTSKETGIPGCVHEWVGAIIAFRATKLEPGQSATIPMSDGKKFAQVKIEAQEREEVKTPLGTFKTIRYEAFFFDGALINRSARCFLWLTDDAKKTPVQIRVRLQFLIGTINLQLEKEEH
jgi:hypothetical protein